MKSNKIYIAALLLFIIGIGIITTAFAIGGFNIERIINMSNYTEYNKIITGYVKNIIVEDNNVKTIIKESHDGDIHIRYFESEYEVYIMNFNENGVLDNNDGVLRIKKDENYKKWFTRIFSWNIGSISLEILIPANYEGAINIKTSNANINIMNISFEDVYLKTSNAMVDIGNITSEKGIEIKTSNGMISISNTITNGFLKTDSSNGSLKIYNCTIKGQTNCETSNALMEAENLKSTRVYFKTSNGNIKLNNVEADTDINLNTSNSAINVKNIVFGDSLYCRSSNGSISGSLPGSLPDYTIYSGTSNGGNNLPTHYSGGSKIVDVKTSNARIDFSFTG